MKKYKVSDLVGYRKPELQDLAIAEGIDVEGKTRQQLIGELTVIEEEEPVEVKEEPVVVDEGKQKAYDIELRKRLGNRVASNYELELARRRGAGTHLTGEEAVAAEIARRRSKYGK